IGWKKAESSNMKCSALKASAVVGIRDLPPFSPFSCHLAISRHFLAMNRAIAKTWLEPFRNSPELGAADYEAAFTPGLPRRTALNRLNRLREAGLVDRFGEARSTVYQL